ncbi:ATP-binding protein [Streptomyces coeruleorubidus]
MNASRIPVMQAGQALQSLRESGYSLAAAMGEVIDNSLEAKANNIVIRMDEAQPTGRAKKGRVHRILFADDGEGMSEDILHRYPQIGFSTRYMRTDTIGKFGVGAKLAALNFGKRLDVWSRNDVKAPWLHCYFDLEEALEAEENGNQAGIDPPNDSEVPDDIRELLPEGTGTLVAWSKVDRLENGRRAKDFDTLRVEVEKEISRIFRVFLSDGIKISVNGRILLPHDPLFLMSGTWGEKVLRDHYTKKKNSDVWDPQDDSDLEAEIIQQEEVRVGAQSAFLTVTLYPKPVTRKRGRGGDALAEKLRVPDNMGAISFMRMDREISYTNVPRIFPRGVDDPDRFIGIQVSFKPELDDYFGVRNVKRGAEPHDELRERLRSLLKVSVAEARRRLEERWDKVSHQTRERSGEHQPIVEAAAEATRSMPTPRAQGEESLDEALSDLADDVLGESAPAEERQQYIDKVKDLPFTIESVSVSGKQFIDVQHVNGKIIIRLNTRHRFYREMWEPLTAVADSDPATLNPAQAVAAARRTIEALTLLLIAYGKAESMDEDPIERYDELRSYWGMFLSSLLTKVKDVR